MAAPALPAGLDLRARAGSPAFGDVLALQRSAGNQAVAAMLARQVATPAPPLAAAPAAPTTAGPAPAFTIEVPEAAFEKLRLEWGKASWVKGSVTPKGEIQFVGVAAGAAAPSSTVGTSTGSMGLKAEAEREGKTWVSDVMRSVGFAEVNESLTFEAGAKKLELSMGVSGKAITKYPWLTGLTEGKVIGVGVEWDKLAEATVGGFELAGGLAGEGRIQLAGQEFIVKSKVLLSGKAEINWAKVAAELGKRGAQQAGRGALQAVGTEAGATVIAVDAGAVAAGAAAIVVPLAAAAAIGYGMYQGVKNTAAAREAAEHGVLARNQAKAFARSYAKVLTGGRGNDEGAQQAEAQIAALVAQTKAPREMAIVMIEQKQGGYQAIYDKTLARIKDKLFEDAARVFDESHEKDFSLIDEIGETWGQRGVFRNTLRIVLYADE